MATVIVTSDEQLEKVLTKVIRDAQKNSPPLSIRQVMKETGHSYRKIKRLIDEGNIETTLDGKIPVSEIHRLTQPK